MRLRSFFERWQATLENPSASAVLSVPFSALDRTYDRAFGPQPFSWFSFRRTCIFGSLFVAASLGFAGFFCGKPFAMNMPPWESFSASIEYLKIFSKSPDLHHKIGDSLYVVQNASDLAKLDWWPFAFIFTIYFVVVIALASACLVSLSISVSRLFLREMLSARTPFGVFVLFLSNTVLLLIFGASATLFLFILLNIWSWPFVPLLFGLSNISFMAGAGVASSASLCAWFFSGTWLKVVVAVSLFPSLIIAVVFGITLIGFTFRRGFHPFAKLVIDSSLRSPKGVFSFYSAVIATLALLCACLPSLWVWLHRLNTQFGFSTIFGFDFLIISSVVMLCMLLLSWVKVKFHRFHHGSPLLFPDVLFLFVIAIFVIGMGFYIEPIIDCVFPALCPPPNSILSNMALPAVDSIIPGSIVGYFYVISRLDRNSLLNLALHIFGVLSVWDLLMGLLGSCSFRDSAISILCDLVGSIVAAFVLSRVHAIFYPAMDPHHSNPESAES